MNFKALFKASKEVSGAGVEKSIHVFRGESAGSLQPRTKWIFNRSLMSLHSITLADSPRIDTVGELEDKIASPLKASQGVMVHENSFHAMLIRCHCSAGLQTLAHSPPMIHRDAFAFHKPIEHSHSSGARKHPIDAKTCHLKKHLATEAIQSTSLSLERIHNV
jgi:hypothetical protein